MNLGTEAFFSETKKKHFLRYPFLAPDSKLSFAYTSCQCDTISIELIVVRALSQYFLQKMKIICGVRTPGSPLFRMYKLAMWSSSNWVNDSESQSIHSFNISTIDHLAVALMYKLPTFAEIIHHFLSPQLFNDIAFACTCCILHLSAIPRQCMAIISS